MTSRPFRLVTIISEPVVSKEIIALAKHLGASGFTSSDVRGEGSSDKSSGEVPDEKIKIEIVADSILAEKLMSEVAAQYFKNYSIIVYSSEIRVLRPEKF